MDFVFVPHVASQFTQEYPPEYLDVSIILNGLKSLCLYEPEGLQRQQSWGLVPSESFTKKKLASLLVFSLLTPPTTASLLKRGIPVCHLPRPARDLLCHRSLLLF